MTERISNFKDYSERTKRGFSVKDALKDAEELSGKIEEILIVMVIDGETWVTASFDDSLRALGAMEVVKMDLLNGD